MPREMKESGIEWIGDIPTHWSIIKFKYVFDIIGGNGFPDNLQGHCDGDFPFCKVSDINGDCIYIDTANNYVSLAVVKEQKFNVIPQNSILIAKIGAALQKNHRKINKVECCIDNNTQALVPRRQDCIKYLYYITKCIDMGWFDNKGTIPSINNTKLLNFYIPNLELSEQKAIADFLDRRCSEIDAVIEQTKATIEEYKKLKQSIITEAVTKGIRGDRTMKDSGIEWIGEIPAEWDVIKLKYTSDFKQNKYSENDAELRYIGLENIIAWNGQYIETDSVYDKEQSLICDTNDILFGKLRPYLAKVYICPEKQCCSGEFCVISIKEQNTRYMWYQLISHGFIFMVDRSTYGTKMPRANADYIKNMSVSIPPIDEQKEIAEHLDKKCAEMDTLIAKKTALLEEMETYKKSVIYEYVTGKKEIV